MSEYKFIKYRGSYPEGYGDWDYEAVDVSYTNEDIDDMMDSKLHYDVMINTARSIEWHYIDSPPKEWFDSEIESANMYIESRSKWLDFLKRSLGQMESL